VVQEANGTAVIVLASPEAGHALLTEALSRGSVREFAELVPSVADVFREITA